MRCFICKSEASIGAVEYSAMDDNDPGYARVAEVPVCQSCAKRVENDRNVIDRPVLKEFAAQGMSDALDKALGGSGGFIKQGPKRRKLLTFKRKKI